MYKCVCVDARNESFLKYFFLHFRFKTTKISKDQQKKKKNKHRNELQRNERDGEKQIPKRIIIPVDKEQQHREDKSNNNMNKKNYTFFVNL